MGVQKLTTGTTKATPQRKNKHTEKDNNKYFEDATKQNWPVILIPLTSPFLLYIYIYLLGGKELQNAINEFGNSLDQIGNIENIYDSAEYITRNIGSYVYDQILWQCAGFIFILSCVTSVILSVAQINKKHILSPDKITKYSIYIFLLAALIFILMWVATAFIELKLGSITGNIVKIVFMSGASRYIGAVSYSEINIVHMLAMVASALAFISLSIGSFSIISKKVIENIDYNQAGSIIGEQVAHMKIILYAGSACLFSGVFATHAFFTWRAGFLSEPFTQDVKDFGEVTILIWTVQWSIALAGIYLVPIYVLYRRAERIFQSRHKEFGDADRRAWMDQHRLSVSSGEFLIKLLAMLGPLIAGAEVAPTLSRIFAP